MKQELVVDSTTKVGNFEQITTFTSFCAAWFSLLILPQR